MRVWLAVAVGGALGALARWLIGEGVLAIAPSSTGFPWSTLLVNVVGCALIGVLAPLVVGAKPWVAGFVVTGFLGGFTTYSAFAEETFILLDRGDAGGIVLAAGYVLATVAATSAAVALGLRSSTRRRDLGAAS